MPKLPNAIIRVQTTNDGLIIHEAAVHVDSSGRFTVGLPETISDSAKVFFDEGRFSSQCLEFQYGRKGVQSIRGRVLAECIACVKQAIANHYAVSTSSEERLVYKYASGLTYWKNRDGSITYNGGAKDADREGNWAGDREERAGLRLSAFAMTKRTNVRGKTETVEWKMWRAPNQQDDSDIRAQLNAISPGASPDDPDEDRDSWTTMPYDEQAARFFYQTISSLCKIDDTLRAFFGDRKKVQHAIATDANPFLLK